MTAEERRKWIGVLLDKVLTIHEQGKHYQLNMEFEEESSDRSKLYFWDENKLRSDIAAEYAYKALVSVAEMSKQYNTIIELLNNIAISEHGNTHEQTE